MRGGKFFLDTNIFVYALDETRQAQADRASSLIRQGLASGQGAVSYQVVQEFCNVMLKLSRTPRALDLEGYIARTFSRLALVPPSLAMMQAALALHHQHRVAWYDALIVAAAQAADCRILYSEDLQHGREFDRLRVENPFLE
jgi:predicted nucleic acid-binding protein